MGDGARITEHRGALRVRKRLQFDDRLRQIIRRGNTHRARQRKRKSQGEQTAQHSVTFP